MNDKSTKVHEVTLYEIWKQKSYNHPLKTFAGEDIAILDAGIHNEDTSGPDFKNARIRMGNLTYVGDIEIDYNYNDWKSHGHNIDSKYTKVILHASLINRHHQDHVYSRDGRKIPSICFAEFIDDLNLEIMRKKTEENKGESISSVKCSSLVVNLDSGVKETFLRHLGNVRFEKKCKKIYNRLKELQFIKELNLKEPVISYNLTSQFNERKFDHSDFSSKEIWQQLLYELTFEALGFSKNKLQMLHLAQSVNVNFLSKIENDGVLIEKYEAALLFISGLMRESDNSPDPVTAAYREKISLHWNSIRSYYDGIIFEPSSWNFFRLRPQNFPTIRIAGGARILAGLLQRNLIASVAKKINEIHNLDVLTKSLRSVFVVKAHGFWKNHYLLDKASQAEIKYFVGVSRADEIVVNVILPFFAVYFDLFGKPEVVKKIVQLYNIYLERSENQLTNEVARQINMNVLKSRTVYSQGMIELFRSFCSKNRCLECEIGKMVFN
ncbi:MAG: hypothetical protein CVV24_09120 [Ignavibacteriae bacterium HGW-Ignavibacteriae-3]|nr:MAG: hypothetical protein CVV24_09120 [Ignavibacteriae bacterium HGW-Ignavibacteriae-3]